MHVPHSSAGGVGDVENVRMRQVVCHVLLVFLQRGHTNTLSTMEYPAVICTPAPPSSCPLVLALPLSQAPVPATHRPHRHILLHLQSCKMNNAIKLETECDEGRFEVYGGNDPQGRPAKNNSTSGSPLPFLPKPNTDPNVVTWDGPEDPENPKNWSFWYRWWITIACTVMTLNVYVPPDRGDLLSSYTD